MKIDTHQHYWHYRAEDFPWINNAMPLLKRDCMPVDCAAELDAAGVSAVVVVQARQLAKETDFLLQVANANPHVAGVVGWSDLAGHDLDHQLDQWVAHAAFKGLRHILQDEVDVSAWASNPAINHGLSRVQKRRLVYDVLVFDHQLPTVAALCARHDQHWLVLDHVGKPAVRDWLRSPETARRWRSCIDELAALPHLMCKLSGAVTETDWGSRSVITAQDTKSIFSCFDHALQAFGPQRLMFGSDWPVCQLAAPYQGVHGLAHQWASTRLSLEEQTAFWSGNAIACYNLNLQGLVD